MSINLSLKSNKFNKINNLRICLNENLFVSGQFTVLYLFQLRWPSKIYFNLNKV